MAELVSRREALFVLGAAAYGALIGGAPARLAHAGPNTGTIQGKVDLVRLSVGSAVSGYDDVIVMLEDAPNDGRKEKGPFRLRQLNKTFKPRVLIVPQGATVEFPNDDKLFHNVFSVSPQAKFDLGLYKGGVSRTFVFKNAGIVPVYCNIHPQMIAYIVVVSNPFYTRVSDGKFVLTGVPKGSYNAAAWFPFGKTVRQPVEVSAGQTTTLDFTLREQSGSGRHSNKDGKTYSKY